MDHAAATPALLAPGLALPWQGAPPNPLTLSIVVVLLGVAFAAAWLTPIENRLLRGARLYRAKRTLALIFGAFVIALLVTATGTGWDFQYVLSAGIIGIIAGGAAAAISLSLIEDDARRDQDRMPPPIPLDLREFLIDRLQVAMPPYPLGTNEGFRLYRQIENDPLRPPRGHVAVNVLCLPRGSVASQVLKLNGEILAKIVAPNPTGRGENRAHRVAILGLDTTRNPFLLELPPEYANRSIEECERWLLNAEDHDEIITT